MKSLLLVLILVELALLACAGWGVHVHSAQLRDLCTILIASNSVLLIVVSKQVRKKRACCN